MLPAIVVVAPVVVVALFCLAFVGLQLQPKFHLRHKTCLVGKLCASSIRRGIRIRRQTEGGRRRRGGKGRPLGAACGTTNQTVCPASFSLSLSLLACHDIISEGRQSFLLRAFPPDYLLLASSPPLPATCATHACLLYLTGEGIQCVEQS